MASTENCSTEETAITGKQMDCFFDNRIEPWLRTLDSRLNWLSDELNRIREEDKREREQLRVKIIEKDTKLKFYETLFSKLNLNINLENSRTDD